MSIARGIATGIVGPIAGGREGDPTLTLHHDYTRAGYAVKGPELSFTRASTATYFDSSGVMQTAAINAMRKQSHVYESGSWVNKGLLVEGQATNVLRNSTMQGASAGVVPNYWTLGTVAGITGTVVGSGVEDGMDYLEVSFSGTASGNQILQFEQSSAVTIAGLTGQNWTQSVGVKLVSGSLSNIVFRQVIDERTSAGSQILRNISSAGGLSITSAIQRFNFSATTSGGATVARIHPSIYFETSGAVSCTVRVYAPQLEQQSFATSYIPTTAAAVTRSADVATISGTDFSGFYNASEGTIVANARCPASGTMPIIGIDDNSANERMSLYVSGTDPKFIVVDGGVTQADIDGGTITASTSFKFASSYASDKFTVSLNGASTVEDASGTLPTVDRMRVGANQAGNYFFGHIASLKYFSVRKLNAYLQSAST